MLSDSSKEPGLIGFDDVQRARERIAPYVIDTPVLRGRGGLNEMVGAELFFKCENFQRVGAFKFRGAMNAVSTLLPAEMARGVATHSSGNHAAALSLAARIKGVRADVVMPNNSSKVKVEAVRAYGGQIHFCEPTQTAREQTLANLVDRTGASVVHPFNDWRVIAGQGTAALELLSLQNELDILMTPVGGGGLLSGSALVAKTLNPHCRVVAGEPDITGDARQSLQKGRVVEVISSTTIADGLRTSLGEKTLALMQHYVDSIITVSDAEIIAAMRLLWQRLKILIEPSAAVPFAVLLAGKLDVRGLKVGIILSGGNLDLDNLPFDMAR